MTSSQDPTSTSNRTPLSRLRQGDRAIVNTRDLADADSKLLAAMGIGERCEIRVCRAGSPCIVQIQSIRVGIGREVADRITTSPCGCEPGHCDAHPAPPPNPLGS